MEKHNNPDKKKQILYKIINCLNFFGKFKLHLKEHGELYLKEHGLLLQADLYFKVAAICVPENSECFVDRESIKI